MTFQDLQVQTWDMQVCGLEDCRGRFTLKPVWDLRWRATAYS